MKIHAILRQMMRLVTGVLIISGTFACTHEQEPSLSAAPTAPPVSEEPCTNQRSEAQAKQIALDFLRGQGGSLRALSSTLAFETEVITRSEARSLDDKVLDSTANPVDTLLYVLNLHNNQGAVLVSGDKRLTDVVGFIPQGHLDLKNLPKHSGISLFMDAYPKYYGARIEMFRERNKICPPEPLSDWVSKETKSYQIVLGKGDWLEGSPILCPVTWGQNAPYNFRAPFVSDKDQAIAGCVAVATAQLMASHRYPTAPMGKKIQWNLLCRYSKASAVNPKEESIDSILAYVDQVSYLLRITGNLLGNRWGENRTGAYTSDIPELLKTLGYTSAPDLTPFSLEGIISSLDKGCSVIMSGSDKASGGHAWLCDAYMKRVVTMKTRYEEYGFKPDMCYRRRGYVERPPLGSSEGYRRELIREWIGPETKSLEYLLHYNWGWDGWYDGYFSSDVFAPGNGDSYSLYVNNILNVKP